MPRDPQHKPRRVSRLVGAVLSAVTGVFYIVFPPVTTTSFLDATWPAIWWGVFFLIGGVVSSISYWNRSLNLDRIGLSFLLTALGGLLFAQIMVMLEFPISYTRGGGTVVIAMFAAYLTARWQDLRGEEKEAEAAIAATAQARKRVPTESGKRGEVDGDRD